MFGFPKKVSSVQAIESKTDPIEVFVERMILEGYYMSMPDRIMSIPDPKKGKSIKSAVDDAIKTSVDVISRWYTVAEAERDFDSFINKIQVVQRISGNVYDKSLEAVRSDGLVKALRAGLDTSNVFLTLMESKDLNELLYCVRWVEKSNAYQAYLSSKSAIVS